MNMNFMSFFVGKTVASDLGEERSTQLGLISSLMPGSQGVLMAALIARREAPATSAPVDPKAVEAQRKMLQAIEAALAQGSATPARQ
jgi:hypothetical protein